MSPNCGLVYEADSCRVLGKSKETEEETEGEASAEGQDDGETGTGEDEVWNEEEEGKGGWWDEEDSDAPWMTQSTKLVPNTTVALWQFTP